MTAATTATAVYARLVSDIVTLRYKPGQTLSENELAAEYGVSRTPVREALLRLRQSALVEVRAQVGTFVAKVDVDRFREAQFVRETLEVACVELALRRGTPVPADVLVRMRGLLAEQLECAIRRDFVAFTTRDELLHQQICALSGHREVWDTIAVSKVHLDRVRHMSLVTSNVMRELVKDHRRIVDALARLDRTAAVAAVQEHTRATLRIAPRLLKRFPDYFTPSDAADWSLPPAARKDRAP